MFVPHDIEGLDKELYGFLSRYAADKYPEEASQQSSDRDFQRKIGCAHPQASSYAATPDDCAEAERN
jgi:hypothetical protein